METRDLNLTDLDGRYGRLRMSNAYGSELLSLALPIEAQYWNGSQFVTNGGDSCTALTNANFGFGNYLRNLASAEMGGSHAPASVTLVNGKGGLTLTKPSGGDGKYAGSVDVCINLDASATNACAATSAAMPWLLGNWGGTAFTYNPAARATFGAYKTSIIYMREMY
jgi:MSHA biogenesis protein MshQ